MSRQNHLEYTAQYADTSLQPVRRGGTALSAIVNAKYIRALFFTFMATTLGEQLALSLRFGALPDEYGEFVQSSTLP